MDNWIRRSRALVLAAVLALPGVAAAQQATSPKALEMTATNLMAGDARHKEAAKQTSDPNAVMAGDVIRYTLVFTNLRPDSVRNVQFTNPLPGGLQYLAGSAGVDRSDVTIDFSIDGGKSWSAQPMIEVVVDGKPVRQPAPVAQYTDVRWTVRGWVMPKATVTADYKAEMPTPSGAPAAQ